MGGEQLRPNRGEVAYSLGMALDEFGKPGCHPGGARWPLVALQVLDKKLIGSSPGVPKPGHHKAQ